MRHSAIRGQALAILVFLVLLLAVVVGPLVLHFTQKSHDVLQNPPWSRPADPNDPRVRGEVYAATVIALMEHELDGWTGWRPNDFFLWGPGLWADNNANRQRGIIRGVRESVRVLKDHLTKISAPEFDDNLAAADTAFRNDEEKFMLPSAESKFRDGIRALDGYIGGLHTTPMHSKPLNERNVELIRLYQTWTDLLGDEHAKLMKETEEDGSNVPIWRTDDYFYRAQGVAHALYHVHEAIRVEYGEKLQKEDPTVAELQEDVSNALREAARLKPVMVLDGSAAGLFANHRRNLQTYIVEARQKMYSIREELEK
jgi:hypothetical protein